MGMEVGVASELVAVVGRASGVGRGGGVTRQASKRHGESVCVYCTAKRPHRLCVSVFVQSSCNSVQ